MLAFVDVETTGLNPHFHEVWEIGLIVDDKMYEWQLSVDLRKADPGALRVGRFYERWEPEYVNRDAWHRDVAQSVASLTANRHLVGCNPAFDAAFLSKFLHVNGVKNAWHYHLIDVETLMLGYLCAVAPGWEVPLPWKSTDLSKRMGVNPDDFDRHTALADAQWAKAIYDAVTA